MLQPEIAKFQTLGYYYNWKLQVAARGFQPVAVGDRKTDYQIDNYRDSEHSVRLESQTGAFTIELTSCFVSSDRRSHLNLPPWQQKHCKNLPWSYCKMKSGLCANVPILSALEFPLAFDHWQDLILVRIGSKMKGTRYSRCLSDSHSMPLLQRS